MKIAVIIGSLRKDSYNRKVARVLMSLAPKTFEMEIVEIGDLPFFNEDLEGPAQPASWTQFQQKIATFDGILFCAPEYNRSIPAVLKNAIDVGSRANNPWSGKAGAVASASPGNAGGTNGHHQLRQTLMAVGIATMPQPEVCLGRAHELFDANGALINERTKAFLQKFIDGYANWVQKIRANSK